MTVFSGAPSIKYLASEEEGARYYQLVLERLAATGAAWCLRLVLR